MSEMTNAVAVVVPIYKMNMSLDEKTSLNHLVHFLGRYDKYLMAPESLQISFPSFDIKLFKDRYFTGVAAYSNLLLKRWFYEAFAEYKYILIYQFDCLVFSDRLVEWCQMGFDYIGAPWFKIKNTPASGFSRVGNGGLSLRKVESFLRVIDSQRYLVEPVPFWKDLLCTPLKDVQEKFNFPLQYLQKLRVLKAVRQGVVNYMAHYSLNEDHFWSDRAALFYPEFKIAPVETALKFAFECAPQYCFEQNGHQLPFGCHAWTKWDRKFWEPYLLSYQ